MHPQVKPKNPPERQQDIICGVAVDRSSLRRIDKKTVYGLRYKVYGLKP
jgi:hypothetical protein